MSINYLKGVKLIVIKLKLCYNTTRIQADMAELADALDLESNGRPCRFKSCYPHQKMQSLFLRGCVFYLFRIYNRI